MAGGNRTRATTREDLAAVRAILVGPEQRALEALRARLEDPAVQAREVAAVLPQALQLRALDAELARALAPPVEDAITASIRRNPKPLADALFPVMGPAIRKAVAASLVSMVESFNRTLGAQPVVAVADVARSRRFAPAARSARSCCCRRCSSASSRSSSSTARPGCSCSTCRPASPACRTPTWSPAC